MLVTAVFGLLGYAMIRFDYPRLPMVIALVLGANIERSYHQSLAMSDGSFSVFVIRPVALTLFLLILVALLLPPSRALWSRLKSRPTPAPRGA
jgi:putative tricarboxylic transport membrane protein